MPSEFTVRVNGDSIVVPVGSTVAVAMAIAGRPCRTSVTGEPRGPLCGMGTCYECRVTIDNELHSRSCQILCTPGMTVQTT